MKIKLPYNQAAAVSQAAFTLVEAMVSVGVVGIMTLSLFASFNSGFAMMKLTREDLRATQIMLQRMEIIRLYTWNQVRDPVYNTTTFTEKYDPLAAAGGSGIIYTGTVTVTQSPVLSPSATYATNLALIKIQVSWTSGNILRQREMETLVARYGIQNYIYD